MRALALPAAAALACAGLLMACAAEAPPADGAGGAAGDPASSSSSGEAAAGGHGCFSTETTCDGTCVDVTSHPDHCGGCNQSCAIGPNTEGVCVQGQCSSSCAEGFVDTSPEEAGSCTNFLGAHEPYPAACAGCSVENPHSGGCSCPAGASPLTLHVQSDCPGEPMRAKTFLELCLLDGVSVESDFGGAYQVDDGDGWCGATDKCRVGNPLAGGACACPEGFDPIALRSIVRLPCDDSEVGTQVIFCGNPQAPFTAFAGAYQRDDFEPTCRVPNPWTADCSCPEGTTDRAYRVMVDGAAGLFGSTIHLCTGA